MPPTKRRPPDQGGRHKHNKGAVEDSAGKRTGRFVAEYPYVHEDGSPNRLVRRTADKEFPQFSPNGKGGWKPGLNGQPPVLYRLPEIRAAVERGDEIYVVEGEKDVHAAETAGVTATTNPGGAGKWTRELSDSLAGAKVNVVWDQDDAGAKHARAVAADLLDAGATSVTYLAPAAGKDLSDHLAAGLGLVDLLEEDPPAPAQTRSSTPDPRSDGRRLLPAMYQLVRGLLNDHADEHGKALKTPMGEDFRYKALCPAHDDNKESLSVRLGDEQAVVFHCHAGCEPEEVVDALGIRWDEFATARAPDGDDNIEPEVEKEVRKLEIREEARQRGRLEAGGRRVSVPRGGADTGGRPRAPTPRSEVHDHGAAHGGRQHAARRAIQSRQDDRRHQPHRVAGRPQAVPRRVRNSSHREDRVVEL